MNVRDVVKVAWQMTQDHSKKLIWYGAIPAFFTVIVSSVYIAYQYNSLRKASIFSSEDVSNFIETLRYYWELASDYRGLSILILGVGILILLGNYILPPIFKGALIRALVRIDRGESANGSLESGVRHFFPLFEFGIVMGAFGITFLFTESLFVLRWWGQDALFLALPILLFISMAGLVINFLFTYSEYYIVLEDKKIIKSIMESTVLVISNLRKTILVFVLMLLIGARIILNVLLVLLIPMLIVFLATYFATIFLSTFGMVMIGVFSLSILMLSSYLLGLFQVFATAVWVLTFKQLRLKSLGLRGEVYREEDKI